MRERLSAHLGDVYFSDLRAHAARDALILVAAGLDLLDVGVALASDDTDLVARWIAEGLLRKPKAEELARWEGEADSVFESLVVAPWVLARPKRRLDPKAN